MASLQSFSYAFASRQMVAASAGLSPQMTTGEMTKPFQFFTCHSAFPVLSQISSHIPNILAIVFSAARTVAEMLRAFIPSCVLPPDCIFQSR
jgi:hypothetical protein